MKRTTTILTAGSVLVLGGALYMALGRRGPDPAQMTQYKLATVQRGSVRKTVSATGTLQPWTIVDIKSKAGGRVMQMLVDVGTPVKKNQVIALIDPADTKLAVDQARADTASAEAKKAQSQKTYQLQVQQSQIAIANAAASLRSAVSNQSAAATRLATARRDAQNQPRLTNATIEQAKASLNQAVTQRAQLNATNAQARASAKSAYDQAIANANNAQSNLTRQQTLLTKGFVSQQAVDNAKASNDVAQAQVATAKAKLDTLDAELKSNVEAADARVAQARASLRSAQAGSVEIQSRQDAVKEAQSSLKQAEAQVAQARESLRQAKANVETNDIRQLDIATANATETRSRAALDNATETLDQTTVRAPSDGVVLTKYVDQGTIITSGLSLNSTGSSIVQLGDTSRMYVDVKVDETDIANVDEGQKVEISMDAYPGIPFEGKVARIDPQAVVDQNVTMVHVRVEVDNSSPTFRLLKPGMNATCDFIVDEKEDALSVPTSAVQSTDDGSFVQIASGGKPAPADPESGVPADATTVVGVKLTRQPVEVGLEGDEATEITKGLKEGDTVVEQTIEPATPAQEGGGAAVGGFRRH